MRLVQNRESGGPNQDAFPIPPTRFVAATDRSSTRRLAEMVRKVRLVEEPARQTRKPLQGTCPTRLTLPLPRNAQRIEFLPKEGKSGALGFDAG
jgi:hypothetical protein